MEAIISWHNILNAIFVFIVTALFKYIFMYLKSRLLSFFRWRKYKSIMRVRQYAQSSESFQILLANYTAYFVSFLVSLALAMGYIILFSSNWIFIVAAVSPIFIFEILYLIKLDDVQEAKIRRIKLKQWKRGIKSIC